MDNTCSYKLLIEPQVPGMRIWACDNPNCGHEEYVPVMFKDWEFCPYCGRKIINKECLIIKAEVKSTPMVS